MSAQGDPFPPDCAAKFRHVRLLAAGGFGSVHEAVHKELGRTVAVKLLLADMLEQKDQVKRFNNEAQITASAMSEVEPPPRPSTRAWTSLASGAVPAPPVALLVTAAAVPATWVPCQEEL